MCIGTTVPFRRQWVKVGKMPSSLGRMFFGPPFNPLVPRVQKIKIHNLTLNQLPIIEFVKKMVYLGAHYSERQGLMG